MNCLFTLFSYLLLLTTLSDMEALDVNSIEKDLAEFNITCYGDNCDSYQRDTLSSASCHCGIQCVQLGTCCIDSFYSSMPQPQLKPTCRSTYNDFQHYFILDRCPSESVWSSLCNDEWNGEDDVQKLVPVTSLLTSTTYKNYYCLRCHETTDEFLYWTVKIESNVAADEDDLQNSRVSLTYDKDMETWLAIYNEDIGYFPVNLTVLIPFKLRNLIHDCLPDIISDCPEEWYDEEISKKCLSYMSIKEVREIDNSIKYYKNIHCALCNFENLNNVSCKIMIVVPWGGDMSISFTHLLDINPSDGDVVGKVRKCSGDEVWDPYTSKCRTLTCALPNFKVKDGKCVQK